MAQRVDGATFQQLLERAERVELTKDQVARALGVRLDTLEKYCRIGSSEAAAVRLRGLLSRERETRVGSIAGAAATLEAGDRYVIHSAAKILEFTEKRIREVVLQCANRGVSVEYIFPDLDGVRRRFPGAELELSTLVPLNLRDLYVAFMRRLWQECASEGERTSLRDGLTVYQQASGFLFCPWNKTVVFARAKGKSAVYQEPHDVTGGGEPSVWPRVHQSPRVILHLLDAAERIKLAWSEVLSG